MSGDRPHPPTGERDESEAALVAACAAGDAEAWTRFVDRFGPLVVALARRMLARRGLTSDADADDVAGGVFLALLRRDRVLLHRYRPAFRLSTYLGVICRTEVSRVVRRRGPIHSLSDPVGGEAGSGRDAGDGASPLPVDPRARSPLAALLARERTSTLAQVHVALGTLAPRDRLLLTLRYFEDLDYGQIADVLHLRRDSVGQLLHRAKARLADALPALRRWAEQDEG